MKYIRSYNTNLPPSKLVPLFRQRIRNALEWLRNHTDPSSPTPTPPPAPTPTPDPTPQPGDTPINQSQIFLAELTAPTGSENRLHLLRPDQWSLYASAGYILNNPVVPRVDTDGLVKFDGGNINDELNWAVLHDPGPAEGGLLSFEYANITNTEYRNGYFVIRGNDPDNLFFLRIQMRAVGTRNNAFLEGLVRKNGETIGLGISNIPMPQSGIWLPFTAQYDPVTKKVTVKILYGDVTPQEVIYDLSPYPFMSTKFGWCSQGKYGGTATELRSRNISHIVPKGTIEITSTQKRAKGLVSSISGVWAKLKPTKIQYLLLDPVTRSPVGTWTTSSNQVINNNGTWTIGVTAPDMLSYLVRVRLFNDTGTISSVALGALYFGVDQIDAEIGHNMRSTNYYEPHPILSNWGKFVGFPGGPRRPFLPYASINGTHRITTNPSAGRITNFISAGTGRVVSSDAATGQHVIVINADQKPNEKHRYLDFTGDVTEFSVVTDGVTGEISPTWLDNMEGIGIRDLNMCGSNIIPIDTPLPRNKDSDPIFLKEDFDGSFLPVELICRAVAKKHSLKPTFKYWWHVDGADLPDERIREEAVYIRDNLQPSVALVDEMINESWNFKNNERRMFALGLRLGFYGAGTYTNPATPITDPIVWLGEGGDGNKASPALNQGRLVGFNRYGYGYCIWRAKQNVPAGTDIGVNDFWEVAFNLDEISKTARMARAHEHLRRINIRKEIFGASYRDRVKPVLMGQAMDGVRLDDQLALELSMPGYREELWAIGWGWYVYDRGVDYNATNHTVDSLEAAYRADIPYMEARCESAWESARRQGLRLALYEGLRHPSLYTTSSTQYTRTQDALWASDRGRLLVRDIVIAVRKHAPGLVMQYDALAAYYWGLRVTYADKSNPGYVGWHEGLNAPLA